MPLTVNDGQILTDQDATLAAARRAASLLLAAHRSASAGEWEAFVRSPRSFKFDDGKLVRVVPATAPRTAAAPTTIPRPTTPQPRIATEPQSKQEAHAEMQRRASELHPGLTPQEALWQHLNTDAGRRDYDKAARLPDDPAYRLASPSATAPPADSLIAAERAIEQAVREYQSAHPSLTFEAAHGQVMSQRPDLRQQYADWHGNTHRETVVALRSLRGV